MDLHYKDRNLRHRLSAASDSYCSRLGANRPQDAIYPTSEAGADGKPYDGANKYIVHFDKGQMPPAEAFWSLTMYNAGYFFVDNPLNRYTLSSRNKFVPNADGSVDLYLQADSPGKAKEANWLPARRQDLSPCCGCIGQRRHRLRSSTVPGSRLR
jgi:hypothetical protein